MRKLTLIILLFLSSLGHTASTSDSVTDMDDRGRLFVCEYMRVFEDVKCEEHPAPKVYYTSLGNYYGMYVPGSRTLMLNEELDPVFAVSVQVHEYTHMLGWRGMLGWDKCKSEYMARKVTALWQGVPYSDRWRSFYGCRA